MKRVQYIGLIIMMASSVWWGCIEEYPPPVTAGEVDFLVVDGFVNSSSGAAEITLTKAVALASSEETPKELNALVQIEDRMGNVFSLLEKGEGNYGIDGLMVNANTEYRLYIKRSNGKEYRSSYVAVKPVPEIDSLVWTPSKFRDGIEILVNTHDDSNTTRYYQWTFEETYEYVSPFRSLYTYENGQVIPIPTDEYVNRCWRTLPSQKIIIGSSEQLNRDVIQNFPVTTIPAGAQEISIHYSILVKQRALSKDAYTYWLNLQKTTEALGGLFDPQPGKVIGNVSNINDTNEPILGYFDIGEVQEKRIFIRSSELPIDLIVPRDLMGCTVDSVSLENASDIGEVAGLSFVDPIVEILNVIGYTYTRVYCTDCRLQGGTISKPLFWE